MSGLVVSETRWNLVQAENAVEAAALAAAKEFDLLENSVFLEFYARLAHKFSLSVVDMVVGDRIEAETDSEEVST